tara:strand:+ start:14958 stop:15203 length:246 start_codon:yes stop_codon:yes gene_type:complete
MITKKQISYECPHCYTLPSGKIIYSIFKKNGQIYKSAKKTIHSHGNDSLNLKNQNFHRYGHCTSKKNSEIIIMVNDNTIRN